MLTVVAIKALKPRSHKYDHMDPDNPGFGVRVMPSGSKSFQIRYRVGGRGGSLRRLSLGSVDTISLKEARAAYLDAKKQLELGSDPIEVKREAVRQAEQEITFSMLSARYLAEYAVHKRTGAEDERILKHDVLPMWAKLKAKDIKKRDVVALLDRVLSRGATTQANRTFACVRKVFNWAAEKDMVDTTPCAGIKAPAKERTRDRVLSDDEIRTFWRLPLSSRMLGALKLQLLLGQRIGEVLGMCWDEIDLQTRLWTLPAQRAKNGLVHTVPLVDSALEILAELHLLRQENELYVFPSLSGKSPHIRVDSVGTALTRSNQVAGLNHFTAHDLRRTAATRISGAGISREILRQILNHKDNSVTARYDRHRYDNEKRVALQRWERQLQCILMEGEENNVVELLRSGK